MADKGAGGMAVDPVPFTFTRAGDRLAGTLYLPRTAPAAAVVTTGPLTSVKEQAAGVYAAALARRGFAALAFDHRTFGASEGTPRQLEDPLGKVADIGAAVSALQADERLQGLAVVALGACAGGATWPARLPTTRVSAPSPGWPGSTPALRRPTRRRLHAAALPGGAVSPRGRRDDPGGRGGRRRRRDAAAGGVRVLRHGPRRRSQLHQRVRRRILRAPRRRRSGGGHAAGGPVPAGALRARPGPLARPQVLRSP